MKQSPRFFLFIFFFLTTVLFSCNGCFRNGSDVAPEAIKEIVTVDLPVSTFNLPIHYKISNFENWINKIITGKFLETTINPLMNEKDEALLIFTKANPIQFRTEGNNLVCLFPLKVDATLLKSRYGKFLTKQVKPLSTEVIIQLSTTVALNSRWNFVTHFKIKSIRWIEEPVLQIGPIKQNLKKRLNEWLESNEKQLTQILDKEISQSASLEPAISKVWYDLQRPILIHRKSPLVWMKFSCNSIEGKIVLNESSVTCFTAVKAKVMMITDTSSLIQPTKLPPYQPVSLSAGSVSDIYLYAFVSFDEINGEVNRLLHGEEFTAKGYTVSIKKVRAYGSPSGLAVEIKTGKDIKGKMVASGKLEFDPLSQTLLIRNFDYILGSDNTIVNTGEQLLHGMIRDTIASRLILHLDSLILTVPSLVKNGIAKGKSGDVVDITMDELHIKDCEIIMGARHVHFKIHVSAEADLEIKNLKTGRKLNINTTTGKDANVP